MIRTVKRDVQQDIEDGGPEMLTRAVGVGNLLIQAGFGEAGQERVISSGVLAGQGGALGQCNVGPYRD